MSIILLTHEFAPFRGGAATYVAETAGAAVRLGIEVEVWAPDRLQMTAAETTFHVEHLHCSGRLGASGIVALIWELSRKRRQLRGRRVILLSAGAHMAWAALRAAGIVTGAHATAFFHGSEVFKFEGSRLWRGMMRRLYAEVDDYAAASRYVAHLVKNSALADNTKPLRLAPCAVPHELRPPAVPVEGGAGYRLLTVARLHPRKGQVETAQALGRLPAELRAQVTYQMVGTGESWYRAQIEEACRRAQVRHEFLGPLEHLGPVYHGCDVYVQSSRTLPQSVEGFGISYLEAAACGKPSVGVRTGGVDEAVIDGVTGLLASEGDLKAFADHIQRLLTNPPLRKQMGEAGRKHAGSFSWESSARALLL